MEFTPQYKNFMSCKDRVCSFRTWPKYINPQPKELAEAGFVYTGCSDIVFCFYCGVRLKDWRPTDEALGEHKRWGKKCGFLEMMTTTDMDSIPCDTQGATSLGYDETG